MSVKDDSGGQDNTGTMSMEDIRDMSPLEIFQYFKFMGSVTPGAEGLSFKLDAKSTGIAILMLLVYPDGERVFVYNQDKDTESDISMEEDGPVYKNAAYITRKLRKAEILPDMTASVDGDSGKHSITAPGFTSEQVGNKKSDFNLEIADARSWSYSKGMVDAVIEEIEAHIFDPVYGIIQDAQIALSIMPIYNSGQNAVDESVEMALQREEDEMRHYEENTEANNE